MAEGSDGDGTAAEPDGEPASVDGAASPADETGDDAGRAAAGDTGRVDPETLRTEIAVLREENERLRAAYGEATRTRHRRTALGFAAVGVLAIAGSLLLPDARDVLLALGGTGLFAGLLVVYLSPERFVAASVGRDVYAAMADNEASVAAELGLTDERVYVPIDEGGTVRLFVPQHPEYELPPAESLTDVLVVTENDASRGVSLRPTGGPLVDEFERSAPGDRSRDPGALAQGLAEALVEQFEVLDSVSVDAEPGRVTVAASESAFGPCDRFDHPIGSVLAVGLARSLDEPVELSVRASADERADWQLTCRWERDAVE